MMMVMVMMMIWWEHIDHSKKRTTQCWWEIWWRISQFGTYSKEMMFRARFDNWWPTNIEMWTGKGHDNGWIGSRQSELGQLSIFRHLKWSKKGMVSVVLQGTVPVNRTILQNHRIFRYWPSTIGHQWPLWHGYGSAKSKTAKLKKGLHKQDGLWAQKQISFGLSMGRWNSMFLIAYHLESSQSLGI